MKDPKISLEIITPEQQEKERNSAYNYFSIEDPAKKTFNEMMELYKKCDPQTQEEREFFFEELGKKVDKDLVEK